MASAWFKTWRKQSFARGAMPFLALMTLGTFGLSQFLKLPTQLKDERRKRKKEGREKFDLDKELEKTTLQLGDTPDVYENKRIEAAPGSKLAQKRKQRVAAD